MNDYQVFLLAAGSNKHAKKPCSLWSFSNEKSILDWQINAFNKSLRNSKIEIIVGYDHQRIIANYPHLNFSHALKWQTSNAVISARNFKQLIFFRS